jgi:hypothetical protein
MVPHSFQLIESHSYVQAMLHAPLWIVALSLIMCGSFGSQGRPGCFVDGGEEALQVVDDTGAGAGRTHRVENQCTATDPHCSDLVEGAAYAAGEVAGDSSAHPQAPSAADPLLQLDRARSLLDQANAALNRGLPVDSRRLAQHAAHVLQQADESNAQSGLLTWTLSSWEWFRVLSLKARVASTGGNATEAIVALWTAVQILESSPPRSTSPVDGRPMEMEVTRAPWHATRLCPQAPFLRGITLMDSQPASALDSSCPVHPHVRDCGVHGTVHTVSQPSSQPLSMRLTFAACVLSEVFPTVPLVDHRNIDGPQRGADGGPALQRLARDAETRRVVSARRC